MGKEADVACANSLVVIRVRVGGAELLGNAGLRCVGQVVAWSAETPLIVLIPQKVVSFVAKALILFYVKNLELETIFATYDSLRGEDIAFFALTY